MILVLLRNFSAGVLLLAGMLTSLGGTQHVVELLTDAEVVDTLRVSRRMNLFSMISRRKMQNFFILSLEKPIPPCDGYWSQVHIQTA